MQGFRRRGYARPEPRSRGVGPVPSNWLVWNDINSRARSEGSQRCSEETLRFQSRRDSRTSFEWVEKLGAEKSEIAFISCGHFESVHASDCSNHGVFEEMIRLSLHQAGPFTEAPRIHRQHVVGSFQLIHPGLDVEVLSRVLRSSLFDTSLQFSHCYGRDIDLVISQAPNPAE